MLNKLNITKLDYLKVAVIFFPVIIYPPFFFEHSFPQLIRVALLFILCIYLFLGSFRYTVRDVIILGFFVLYLIILISTNQKGISGLIHIGGSFSIMFFGWFLYRYLLLNKQRVEKLLKLYVSFFYFAVICSIFSLIYFQIAGELDLFGYSSDKHPHLVTPFGILFRKDFELIEVYRSIFFFHEALHASLFFAANIVIVAPLLKQKSRLFLILNLIGGFLLIPITFTFYVLLTVLYFVSACRRRHLKSIIYWMIWLLLCYFVVVVTQFYLHSSLSVRLEGFNSFFMLMDEASIKQLFFGYGVADFSDGAFHSGITTSIYEFGYIGFALQMSIFFLLRPNLLFIALALTSSLIINPMQWPLFWFLIMVAGEKMRNEASTSKSLISKSNI
jgi:hypothetical protein